LGELIFFKLLFSFSCRTIDIIVFHYGNGTLKNFVGIGETILDVVSFTHEL